jgi:hypothetical protein
LTAQSDDPAEFQSRRSCCRFRAAFAHGIVDHRRADRKRGLALWAYCGYGAWRGLAALGTNCDDDTRACCQPATHRVIEWAPPVTEFAVPPCHTVASGIRVTR